MSDSTGIHPDLLKIAKTIPIKVQNSIQVITAQFLFYPTYNNNIIMIIFSQFINSYIRNILNNNYL